MALLILLKVLQLNQVLIETGKQKGIEWQLYNDLHIYIKFEKTSIDIFKKNSRTKQNYL